MYDDVLNELVKDHVKEAQQVFKSKDKQAYIVWKEGDCLLKQKDLFEKISKASAEAYQQTQA